MGVGTLTLVATPIGNLGDLSPRAAEALASSDFWIVEDTRVSGKLQAHLSLSRPMRVLNEHTGEAQIESYVREIAAGSKAVLLTDGGSPTISDPGSRICDLCHDQGLAVEAIPGPSAVITSLMLSGFYAQRFCFLGFLGRKPGAIRSELEPFQDSPMTIVLFESPHRIGTLIEVAGEKLGRRRYAICREMTKIHEQVFRAVLPHVPNEKELPRKGEVTVVIEGRRRAALQNPTRMVE